MLCGAPSPKQIHDLDGLAGRSSAARKECLLVLG
jgi:hypothetical protein